MRCSGVTFVVGRRPRDVAVGTDKAAAWTIDALTLYVNAFCLETSLLNRHADKEEWTVSRDELLGRFAALPDTFPNTKPHAAELTSGTALNLIEHLQAAPATAPTNR